MTYPRRFAPGNMAVEAGVGWSTAMSRPSYVELDCLSPLSRTTTEGSAIKVCMMGM